MSRLSLCSATTIALASLFLTFGAMAQAQGVPGVDKNKCLAGKTKCVGKLTSGLLKCRELCQKSTTKCGQAQTDCEAKVMAKYDGGDKPEKGCFAKLEAKDDPSKLDSVCTTTGDSVAMEAEVGAAAAELLDRLEGTPAPTCGDGVINAAGEQCDAADLDGYTCGTFGLPGTLGCNGSCNFDVSQCTDGTPAPTCGDGVINAAGEQCDSADLDGYTCGTFGLPGTLGCDGACDFDVTRCTECAELGGIEMGGVCWFNGALGQNCTDACADRGWIYDVATRDYAGSAGTNANCRAVNDALGNSGDQVADFNCPVSAGCTWFPVQEDRVRCVAPPTTADGAQPGARRVCACQPAIELELPAAQCPTAYYLTGFNEAGALICRLVAPDACEEDCVAHCDTQSALDLQLCAATRQQALFACQGNSSCIAQVEATYQACVNTADADFQACVSGAAGCVAACPADEIEVTP